MNDFLHDIPDRIVPYLTSTDVNAPVLQIPGPFRLVGPSMGTLDSDLVFRWIPSAAVAFEGESSISMIDFNAEWSLECDTPSFKTPILITNAELGTAPTRVRGIIRESLSLGREPFSVLRFCLANFPDYIGLTFRYKQGESTGGKPGRLQVIADEGECVVDDIPEAHDLRETAERDSGFVISHVGQWVPVSGKITIEEAEGVLQMLHMWFGLLRGTWSGPLFPQGLDDGEVIWRQITAWNVRESHEVSSWMPRRKPLELSEMFSGFLKVWNDPAWKSPLNFSISWLVEANAHGTAQESRIILAQVALELLAWVHIVETRQSHARTDFKRLSAAGRIRVLLEQLSIPAGIPEYMTHLPSLCRGDAFDGPGVVTRVRNALVHATEDNRTVIESLDGIMLYEASQLALQYVELVLLAICGYNGHYARRGWRGWRGDDEVLVPWVQAD